MFAAVQSQSETYFSYLPHISSCLYNISDVRPGLVTNLILDSDIFFKQVQYDDALSFWSPVRNGLNTLMALQDEETGYDGKIYYNSRLQDFNRELIFYKIIDDGLQLDFALTAFTINNLTVNISVQNSINITLEDDALDILGNCSNFTENNFAFVGNSSYIFVCNVSIGGFIFNT